MRLAFGSVDSVKYIAPLAVSGRQPTCGEIRWNTMRKRNSSLFPASLLDLGHLISSSAFGLGFTPPALLVHRSSDSD